MNKDGILQQRAIELRSLLEKYAKTDSDVDDFLKRFMPWFEKISKGEITPPNYDYRLSIYFSNPDFSPLAERYMGHELGKAEAEFTKAICDW